MGKNLNQLNEDKYPLFVSFLRENDIYDSYVEYAHSISDYFMPHLAISGAFYFGISDEGFEFWTKINNKWSVYYKQFEDESI